MIVVPVAAKSHPSFFARMPQKRSEKDRLKKQTKAGKRSPSRGEVAVGGRRSQ
jgi:hypothetical protein